MTKLAIIAMKKISSGQKNLHIAKGQLNSEWIYEVIVSSKMPYPGSLLDGRAEISVIFGWHFGRNDDLINSFWI